MAEINFHERDIGYERDIGALASAFERRDPDVHHHLFRIPGDAVTLATELAEWAIARPLPMAAYALPEWPEGDPRWALLDAMPGWWPEREIDELAAEARKLVAERRAEVVRGAIESGAVTRTHAASVLGGFAALRALLGET